MIHGVGRDAERIAKAIARRASEPSEESDRGIGVTERVGAG
jgi:hypothetical protein